MHTAPPGALRRTLMILAAVAPLVSTAGASGPDAAQTQSPSALRRENDNLRERVAELEAELEETRRQLLLLQETIDSLRIRLEAAPVGVGAVDEVTGERAPAPGAAPTGSAPIPEDPLASPASMIRALTADLRPLHVVVNMENEVERARYLRDARRWARVQQHQRKGLVEWRLRLHETQRLQDGRTRFQWYVLHPEQDAPVGDPIAITPDERDAERILAAPATKRWRLSALFTPRPTVNPDRVSPGVYNVPPLLGPYVEFEYDLDIKVIAPADEGSSVGEDEGP